jgi:hypothetical protein
MSAAPQTIATNLTLAQWFARLFSLPVGGLIFFLLYMLLSSTEDVIPAHTPLMICITIALACIPIAWFWGYWGGFALLLTSVAVWLAECYLFTVMDLIATNTPEAPFLSLAWPSWFTLILFATGLLFVLAHRYRR